MASSSETDSQISLLRQLINQHHEDIDNLKGLSGEITLYEVDIANTNYGTVTLNDDLSNYKIIEIYAATDDKHVVYQKVASPNGKYVSFSAALVGQANFFTKCKVYYMSGNTIKTGTYAGNNMAGMWGTHDSSSWTRSEEYIGIYRVDGYK